MLVTYCDFGDGPYVGQMVAQLHRWAPTVSVVALMNDAPRCNPRAAAYLLAALVASFPESAVFVCVVDPGVGGKRRPVALNTGERWFVGPDNGLLEMVARRTEAAQWYEIIWEPPLLSRSFHGRDLFAPVAAQLAIGADPAQLLRPIPGPEHGFSDELDEIVYIDSYGNLLTGRRACGVDPRAKLWVGGRRVDHARTFSEVPTGELFWYENAFGLVEVAANLGSAALELGAAVGDVIAMEGSAPSA